MKVNILSIKEIETVFNTFSSHMVKNAECTIAEIFKSTGERCEVRLSVDKSKTPFVECKVLLTNENSEAYLPGSCAIQVREVKEVFQNILTALTQDWDNTPEGYIIFTIANYISAYLNNKPVDPFRTLDEIGPMRSVTDGFSTVKICGTSDNEKLSLMDAITIKFDKYSSVIHYHKDTRDHMITVFSINYCGETLRKFLEDIETPANAYFTVI